MQGKDEVIELIDEEGNEVKFTYEADFDFEGNEYVVLATVEQESDDEEYAEVVILKLKKSDDGEECLETIEDEKEGDRVFQEFLKLREEEEEEE